MTRKTKAIWRHLSLSQRGITTSEFWMTGITVISTICGLITGNKAVIVGIVVASYVISRGIKKINNP